MNWYKKAQFNNTQEIVNKWSAQGITLMIFEYDDKIVLDLIVVPSNMRDRGIGTQVMNDLIAYADQVGKRIELSPGQKGDLNAVTSRKKLINWYKRFGFIENKGRNKDFTTTKGMYRNSPEKLK